MWWINRTWSQRPTGTPSPWDPKLTPPKCEDIGIVGKAASEGYRCPLVVCDYTLTCQKFQ